MLVVLLFVLVDTVIIIVVLPQDNVRHSVAIIDNKQDPGFTRNVSYSAGARISYSWKQNR